MLRGVKTFHFEQIFSVSDSHDKCVCVVVSVLVPLGSRLLPLVEKVATDRARMLLSRCCWICFAHNFFTKPQLKPSDQLTSWSQAEQAEIWYTLQRSAKQSSGVKRQLRRVGEQKYVFYMQKSRSLGMPCRCPRSCNMQRKHTKTYKAPKAPKHLIGLVGLLRLVWLDLQSPVLMSCCKS